MKHKKKLGTKLPVFRLQSGRRKKIGQNVLKRKRKTKENRRNEDTILFKLNRIPLLKGKTLRAEIVGKAIKFRYVILRCD